MSIEEIQKALAEALDSLSQAEGENLASIIFDEGGDGEEMETALYYINEMILMVDRYVDKQYESKKKRKSPKLENN